MRKVLSIFIALSLVALLCAGIAGPVPNARAAVSWYVDPSGTDDGSHGTAAGGDAFLTIQYAINDSRVGTGDTINVAAGIYRERVTVSKSVTLTGDPGDPAVVGPGANAPVLDGDINNDGTLENGDGFTIVNDADGVTIEGFIVRNFASGSTGQGVGVKAWNVLASDNITVRDNRFTDCKYAAVMAGNAGQSIHANWNVTYNEVTGCGVSNSGPGIELTNVTGSTIDHNTVTGGAWGILLTAQGPKASVLVAGSNTVSNNTVANSLAANIMLTTWNNERDTLTAKPVMSGVTVVGNTLTNTAAVSSSGGGGSGFGGRLLCAELNAGGALANLTITDNELDMSLLATLWNGSAVFMNTIGGTSVFSRNTYVATGAMSGSAYFHAVDLSGTGTSAWTLADNELSGNNGGNDSQAGIQMDLFGTDAVSITGCIITGLKTGISATSAAGASVTVDQCSLTGNSAYGVKNVYSTTAAAIDATHNWWGDASGPGPAGNGGPGSGSNVSATVTYSPWLGDGTDTKTAVGFQPNLTPLIDLVLTPTRLAFTTQPGGILARRETDICPGSGNSSPGGPNFSDYNYRNLTVFNGKLYFQATSNATYATRDAELWSYDGTTASIVADIWLGTGSSSPTYLTVFNGKLYFSANGNDGVGIELWCYDGVNAPSRVTNLNGANSSSPAHMTVFNGKLYFSASAGGSIGTELYSYDGTTVSLAANINPGSSPSNPQELKVFNGRLYFQASDGTTGAELWSFDGTTASRVADILTGSSGSSPTYLTVFDNKLYFAASDGGTVPAHERELWFYDGVNPPALAANINTSTWGTGGINENGSAPKYLTVFNGKLYFQANDSTSGAELWSFDGTTASRVADIYPGSSASSPAFLKVFNDKLYFSATDNGTTYVELWSFDGVNAPSLAVDIRPGGSSTPMFMTVFNGRLYFQANGGDGAGVELWSYGTGTPAGIAFPVQPVVTVLDNIGGAASTFGGTVSVAIGTNPGSGWLGGVTSVTAVDGVATFSGLYIDKGGPAYTLAASSGALTPGTSNPFDVNHPAPVLTNVSPTWKAAGGAGFALSVYGTGFATTSKVYWNGSERATTYVSAAELTAAILPADIASAGTASVTVAAPTPGGGTSEQQTFTVYVPVAWVDGSFSAGNCGGHVWGYDAFNTIQEAVVAVAPGGTVNVAAGAYAGSLNLQRALTITGDSTVIDGDVTLAANPLVMTGVTLATGHDWHVTAGGAIQDSINAASPGDTINVAAGTYAGNIIVNKSLTIVGNPGDAAAGPGANAPVIEGGSAPGDAFKIANGVSNVTIKGFEIRNFTSSSTGVGNGIQAWQTSTSNITIEDNWFHNLGWNGVLVGNDTPFAGSHTGWTVKNNILETFKAYGFELTNTSSSSIENNIIHADLASAPVTCIMIKANRSQSGITIKGNTIDGAIAPWLPAYAGYAPIFVAAGDSGGGVAIPCNLDGVLIENNTITAMGGRDHVYLANYVGGTITGVHAHGNSFTTLRNGTPAAVDASCNWWGTANGTTIASQIAGSGLALVTYAPWYDCADMHQLYASGDLVVPTGTTLNVPAGKSLVVDGTLTIQSGGTLTVTEGSLTVDGTTVSGTFTLDDSYGTLTITENFTVEAGGDVTWNNSHVVVANGATITVKAGGHLHITGGSLVEKAVGSLNYYLVVENGATFQMEDSTLEDCGTTGTGAQAGLYIDTPTATILRSTLSNNYVGLALGANNASTVEFHNNAIMNNIEDDVYNNGPGTTLEATLNWWGTKTGADTNRIHGGVFYGSPSSAVLSLVSSSGSTHWANGQEFDVTVHFDANGVGVNALDAWITYEADHLLVTGVDWVTSHPFAQEIERDYATPGTVKIAAGATSPLYLVSGDVAIIHFTTKIATETTTPIAFSETGEMVTAVMMPYPHNINAPINVLTSTTGLAEDINDITLTYTAGSNGHIDGDVDQIVNYGASGTEVTASPDTGYHFVKWSDNNSTVAARTDSNVTASITTEATFAIDNYTVTFDKNGGTTEADPAHLHADYNTTVTLPTPPAKTGYTFASWNTATEGTGSTFTASTPVTGDITVYAQWTINQYTVTFNKNGGDTEASPASILTNYNTTVTLPTPPTRVNYSFTVWNTAADGSGSQFTASTLITADITVYAQWAGDMHTVTITIDHGTHNQTVPVTVEYGHDLTLTVTPSLYYYVYSTKRGEASAVPLDYEHRMLGEARTLTFTDITDDTAITINIYRRGDIAGPDGIVGISDASILMTQWRETTASWVAPDHTGDLLADLNCDDVVNVYDLSMMMFLWQQP